MIETDRLVLRPMRIEDTDAFLLIFTDVKVMASFGGILFERQQMEHWVQRNLDHQTRYGYGLFSVIHKRDNLLIGDCGLEHMGLDQQTVTELGYDLRSDYWNQGLATEAASAVRDFAWHQLNLPELTSLIRRGNQASRRVAEKIGMQQRGVLKREEIEYWLYGIPRPATE